MNKNEVKVAFEILIKEIERVLNILTQEGEEALKSHDFRKAQSLTADGERVKSFIDKVKDLQREWQRTFGKAGTASSRKKNLNRKLKRGLRTPENEFVMPILKALIELGGKAEMKEVLDNVYEKMKDRFNKYDMGSLPSNPKQKRWENTAQWARNRLVNEGLLSADSSRGVWEITEKGKKFYNENRKV